MQDTSFDRDTFDLDLQLLSVQPNKEAYSICALLRLFYSLQKAYQIRSAGQGYLTPSRLTLTPTLE